MLEIFGNLHVLFLHLPIGILLLAIIFEWLDYFKWKAISHESRLLTFQIGALTAFISCLTGYVLSRSSEYSGQQSDNHMWAGLITLGISVFLCYYNSNEKAKNSHWISLLLGISIVVTGHLGASLTHGADFLLYKKESATYQPPVFKFEDASKAVVFEDLILPIVTSKCVSCHGDKKKKGRLRMDQADYWDLGGKSKKSLFSKKDNPLVHRVELPLSDGKHMPPRKKPQMTSKELRLIKWWLTKGASVTADMASLGAGPQEIELVESIIEKSKKVEDHTVSTVPARLPQVDLPIASPQSMQRLVDLNIIALKAGKESNLLEVNMINVASLDEAHWEAINSIADRITRLKLSGHKLDERWIALISKMSYLTKLHLDHTNVSDEMIRQLGVFQHLSYLNLGFTEVSDMGLSGLKIQPNLHEIYAYKSAITEKSNRDSMSIILGSYQLENLPSDSLRLSD